MKTVFSDCVQVQVEVVEEVTWRPAGCEWWTVDVDVPEAFTDRATSDEPSHFQRTGEPGLFDLQSAEKGVHKKLPVCSYCKRRGLPCNYCYDGDGSALSRPSPSNGKVLTPEFVSPLVQPCSIGDLSLPCEPSAIQQVVYRHIRSIYYSVGLTFSETVRRFSHTFQNWLPIISPARLREIAGTSERSVPSADVSILLLSICLVTARPDEDVCVESASPASLYVSTKMLHGQVQAVVQASTPLVQAGLIISAYEYASSQLDSAYVSIAVCARMAQSLGIDKAGHPGAECHDGVQAIASAGEHCNLWWAIVVLERFILLEMSPSRYQYPTAACPGCSISLPSDFDCDDVPSHRSGEKPGCSSSDRRARISSFTRQAETVYLLDQTLRIINSPATPEQRLGQLCELDQRLQDDLMKLMEERVYAKGLRCGAIATVIRSLYVLHSEIMAYASSSSRVDGHEPWQTRSKAALDTATRIMVEVAEHHLGHIAHHGVDSLPFCCGCNIRVAIRYIECHCHGACGGDRLFSGGLQKLVNLEKAFSRRWQKAASSGLLRPQRHELLRR